MCIDVCLSNYANVANFCCLHVQSGPRELTEKSQGVNYRALGDLFHIANQRKDTFCYDVSVQMIEIYNEQVRDLLITDGTNKRYPLQVIWFCY